MRLISSSRNGLAKILLLVGSISVLLISSCGWDGQLKMAGYSTRPQYDMNVRTVYVPIFKNTTMWRGLEFDLTRAVVREIESKTPYKVVSDCNNADTELEGTIVMMTKNILNRNQMNEVREAETTLGVEIVWRDLKSGEVLSRPRRDQNAPFPVVPSMPPGKGMPEPAIPAMPEAPPPEGLVPPPPPPILVRSVAGFIPELGESITTAQKKNIDRLATQIVSLMEEAW